MLVALRISIGVATSADVTIGSVAIGIVTCVTISTLLSLCHRRKQGRAEAKDQKVRGEDKRGKDKRGKKWEWGREWTWEWKWGF